MRVQLPGAAGVPLQGRVVGLRVQGPSQCWSGCRALCWCFGRIGGSFLVVSHNKKKESCPMTWENQGHPKSLRICPDSEVKWTLLTGDASGGPQEDVLHLCGISSKKFTERPKAGSCRISQGKRAERVRKLWSLSTPRLGLRLEWSLGRPRKGL